MKRLLPVSIYAIVSQRQTPGLLWRRIDESLSVEVHFFFSRRVPMCNWKENVDENGWEQKMSLLKERPGEGQGAREREKQRKKEKNRVEARHWEWQICSRMYHQKRSFRGVCVFLSLPVWVREWKNIKLKKSVTRENVRKMSFVFVI